MLRVVVRTGWGLFAVWVLLIAVVCLGRVAQPMSQSLIHLDKPSRIATSELVLRDVRVGIVHPLTRDADVLSYAAGPDGRRLLYIARISGAHAFYDMDIYTGEVRFLMSDPTQAITPTWSPDGLQVAYDNYATRTVYLADMMTLRTRRLLHYNGVVLAFPDWSPDGARLVMTAPHPETDNPDLMFYNLEDGAVEWLTDNAEAESHPRFSPDGTQLVYRVVRGARHELVRQDLETGETEMLFTTLDDLWGPDWSADGGRVAFQVIRGGRSNIYVIDVATLETLPLTGGTGWASNPMWLP